MLDYDERIRPSRTSEDTRENALVALSNEANTAFSEHEVVGINKASRSKKSDWDVVEMEGRKSLK